MASVRERITLCVEKFTSAGGLIVDEDWNVVRREGRYEPGPLEEVADADLENNKADTPACCPLGAVLCAADPREWQNDKDKDAANVLGVSEQWVEFFVAGFDGNDPPSEIGVDEEDDDGLNDAYSMGQDFRERYISW